MSDVNYYIQLSKNHKNSYCLKKPLDLYGNIDIFNFK